MRKAFTLVELLLAVTMSVAILAAAYSMYDSAKKVDRSADELSQKVTDVAGTMRSIESDVLATIPFRFTDENVMSIQPSYNGGSTTFSLITTAVNNQRLQSPDIQKITYAVDSDGNLTRTATRLDTAGIARPQTVASGVKTLTVKALVKGQWADSFEYSTDKTLPQMVEITVERTDGTTSGRKIVLVTQKWE